MDDYISKPIHQDQLSAIIDKWLFGESHSPKDFPIEKTESDDKKWDREVLLNALGGDEEFMIELINVFLTETNKQFQSLNTGINNINFALIERAAHTIKGSAGNIRATSLQRIAAKLESAGNKHNLDQIKKLSASTEQEFSKLAKILKSQVGPVEA